jgi:hypothetical protein
LSLEECSQKCNVPDLSKSRSLACSAMQNHYGRGGADRPGRARGRVLVSASERKAAVVMGRMHNLVLVALLGLALLLVYGLIGWLAG